MNARTSTPHHHRSQLGRSNRFDLGLLASAALAAVLLAALYLSAPSAGSPAVGAPNHEVKQAVQHASLSSGTGTEEPLAPATTPPHSATFHEDADLRQLAPEPDPSAAAVAAY